ncbi:methyltransferase-like protein 27 isoform X3 [Amphiura filiformis]|uniref:methyltransferase-like protein 27 isoform X3 n=1 Tax=Amphiura filiformis TaxID=82378 RepID=UPI003B21B84C
MADKIRTAKEGRIPTTLEGIKQFYDDWAPTYEKDLTHEGYIAPRRSAEAMAKCLTNKDAEIMDMACGTGLVAQELTQQGFKNIDGVDISSEILKICKESGLYRRLICDSIGTNKLDINDGGPIIFSVDGNSMDTFDHFKDGKFEAALQELVRNGLWIKESYELIPDWVFNRPGHQYVYKVV